MWIFKLIPPLISEMPANLKAMIKIIKNVTWNQFYQSKPIKLCALQGITVLDLKKYTHWLTFHTKDLTFNNNLQVQ